MAGRRSENGAVGGRLAWAASVYLSRLDGGMENIDGDGL
jgi:hypothetical protein